MTATPLTTAQQAEARRIYEQLRLLVDSDLQQIAELLAGKPDDQLLGATEFDLRDRVHRLGAKALETALAGRKKGATPVPAPAAPTAPARPGSSATRARPC